jgi:hypothetical protein
MSTEVADAPFRRRQHVVAAVELPGVPVGTAGRVMQVVGVTWKRARIHFENGEEISGLDTRHVVTREEWAEREAEQRQAELRARQEQMAADARARLAASGPAPAAH